MSKRAETAALKVYPPTYTTVKRYANRVQSELVDTHTPVRAIFQQGYEQAEKDFIERLAKFYPTLDYTFRSYLLQDFPELESKIKNCE